MQNFLSILTTVRASRLIASIVLGLIALGQPALAAATSIDFNCSHNRDVNCSGGKYRPNSDITQLPAGTVISTLVNNGSGRSWISRIQEEAEFDKSAQSYKQWGRKALAFKFPADFNFGTSRRPPRNLFDNGIDRDFESLLPRFPLDAEFSSWLADLKSWQPGHNRHSHEFERGYSEDFRSQTTAAVPLPASAWLLVSGLLGIIGVARKHSSATATA